MANDVAVMRVSQPFTLNNNVRAATIPSSSFNPASQLVAAGWGTLSSGGSLPTVLMKVTVPLVSTATCRNAYGSQIVNGMLCAGTAGKVFFMLRQKWCIKDILGCNEDVNKINSQLLRTHAKETLAVPLCQAPPSSELSAGDTDVLPLATQEYTPASLTSPLGSITKPDKRVINQIQVKSIKNIFAMIKFA